MSLSNLLEQSKEYRELGQTERDGLRLYLQAKRLAAISGIDYFNDVDALLKDSADWTPVAPTEQSAIAVYSDIVAAQNNGAVVINDVDALKAEAIHFLAIPGKLRDQALGFIYQKIAEAEGAASGGTIPGDGNVVPGDPFFLGQNYELGGTMDVANYINNLAWTSPGFETINTITSTKLFLQQSTTKDNIPPEGNTLAPSHPNWYVCDTRTEPTPEDGWLTIKTWTEAAANNTHAYAVDFHLTPTTVYAYRLMIIFGVTDGLTSWSVQINWNSALFIPPQTLRWDRHADTDGIQKTFLTWDVPTIFW